jgi:hypothetical protein
MWLVIVGVLILGLGILALIDTSGGADLIRVDRNTSRVMRDAPRARKKKKILVRRRRR